MDYSELENGDIVKIREGEQVNIQNGDLFFGTAFFRGQSETHEDCVVLEMIDDTEKWTMGGGQNKWWNFSKQLLPYLDVVKKINPPHEPEVKIHLNWDEIKSEPK